MKRGKALPILLLLLTCPEVAARAVPQITFVQPPPPNRSQNPESLPPEKKKSLSGIGPDEVFREQDEASPAKRRSENRPRSTSKPEATPAPAATPTIRQPRGTPTSLPAVGPIITSSPSQPHPPPNVNNWLLQGLGVLTLLVFIALIFVLGRLRQLLRET
ncbi:MAG: hypothetical protein ACKVX9_09995 [Blastocatellia bacterium]